jgi:hypothetical protein
MVGYHGNLSLSGASGSTQSAAQKVQAVTAKVTKLKRSA